MRSTIALALLAPLSLVPRLARAADVILDHLPPGAIKLDGKVTKEWPGTTAGSETVKAGKASASFVAGYDDAGLWIGAEVTKDGPNVKDTDCISLIIAFPKSGVSKGAIDSVHEVGLYPGVPGSSSGTVKFRGGPLSGKTIDAAKIIEAPRKPSGYTVEAFIPWSAFPDGKKVRAGLRGALRLYDSSGAIKATGPGSVESPSALGYLLIEPEQSLPQALASKKQTLKDASFDVSADLGGDATHERALFFGRTLYVLGPGYKEGKLWAALDLGADVVNVETRDATGNGKQDLVLTTRVKVSGVTREAVAVWSFLGAKGNEVPTRVFAHETLVESGSNALRDNLAFGSGKKPTITATYDKPKGYTVDTYKEPIASDVDPILWPWGTVKERTFAWNGSAFTKDKELPQKGQLPTAAMEPPTVKAPNSEVLPPPSDLVAAALKQYKKDKGLAPDAISRFDASASVIPGKKGRVSLFGKDLVIATGDGGYVLISMSRFVVDKDVIEITARDLTGDGRDDIIVRGILRAKLTGGGKEQEVLREVMFIYSPKPQGSGLALNPVFGVETSRAMGKDLVEANFRIITAKGSAPGKIELMKGSAKGFGKGNWPFGNEQPTPGIEPLLLPWGSESSVTYTWKGDKFAR